MNLNQYERKRILDISRIIGWSLICIAVGLMIGSGVVSALSVEEYGTDYIIYNVSGESQIVIDGVLTNVSGVYYGQYELTPGSVHYASSGDTGLRVVLKDNAYSMLLYWGIYIILVLMIVLSYHYPISGLLPVIFGLYLIVDYLPVINAAFVEYALVGILIASAIIASAMGFRRA